jgi:hypothetical protein
MNLGQALTTNIDPTEVGFYTAVGAALGTGMGAAALGVEAAVTTIGIAQATTAAGTATTVACADNDCGNEAISAVNLVDRGLRAFSHAAEYGIKSYRELRELTKGTGLHCHHIIEARFADTLGLVKGEISSVALTLQEHQEFTTAWRNAIGYANSFNPLKTGTATAQDIWLAAQRIYADYPELLEAARRTIFGE